MEEYRKRSTVAQVGNPGVSVALSGARSDGLGDALSRILAP